MQPVEDYNGPITVDPLALVFYEDWFYLIAYATFRDDIRHYRLDRMTQTEILEKERTKEAYRYEKEIAEYTTSIFKMYGGEEETVILVFDRYALAPVFEKFGENIRIEQIDENHVRLTHRVEVSDVFFGWVDQFRGHLRIMAPENVKKQYREFLAELMKVNEGEAAE